MMKHGWGLTHKDMLVIMCEQWERTGYMIQNEAVRSWWQKYKEERNENLEKN